MESSSDVPYPKTYDWQYEMNKTRPILLLECMRKCMVKILMKRLGNVLQQNNILKGLNYAGLPGESTQTPITILNGLLEDARDKKKTLWVIAQDMSKAFNSVGMIPLEKALARLCIPK